MHISTYLGMMISKIAAYGARKIFMWFTKDHYTPNKWILRIVVSWLHLAFNFENNDGTDCNNGEHCKCMIIYYFWYEIEGIDEEDIWFQQDGATRYTSGVTLDFFMKSYHVISHFVDVIWSPRSCDLIPLDIFVRLR